MEKKGIYIFLFGKTMKISIDESLIPLAREVERLLKEEWERSKSMNLSEEVIKNKVIFAVALDLLAAKKEADKQTDFCLEFLQKLNFKFEEKLNEHVL